MSMVIDGENVGVLRAQLLQIWGRGLPQLTDPDYSNAKSKRNLAIIDCNLLKAPASPLQALSVMCKSHMLQPLAEASGV